jgi:hypothetical protein
MEGSLRMENKTYPLWALEDIRELLEEHPEYKNMSDKELIKEYNNLYWEARGLFDEVNAIESKADTIQKYIEWRKDNE